MKFKIRRMWLKLRHPKWTEEQLTNVMYGFDKDFELPYPYPQNEYEDGMNWVHVNRVTSGRSGW